MVIERMKRLAIDKKIFAKHILGRRLVPKYTKKKLLKFNKKTKSSIKK